jgi:hypothetical protein
MSAAFLHASQAASRGHDSRTDDAGAASEGSRRTGVHVAASNLGGFQTAFARALLADPGEVTAHALVRALAAQPGFAVYRNTFLKACIDALAGNYPAVARLVGDEWFRAAAAVYVRRSPPHDPLLLAYGRSFPQFLAAFAPAADYPYLASVARLDRFWTEAHVASAERPLSAAALAGLAPEALAALVLQPLPSARWHWFEHAPIFSIWSRNRSQTSTTGALDWRPEGALLVRPRSSVEWLPLDAGGCAFLDACAGGRTLAEAAAAAACADPACDVSQLLGNLLVAGVFAATVRHAVEGDTP